MTDSSTSINWDHACVLLGAGFSYDLGMPLVTDLTNEVVARLTPEKLSQFQTRWSQQGQADFIPHDVLAELQAAAKLPNYEMVIGAMEDRYRETRNEGFRTAVRWLTQLVNLILVLRHRDNIDRIKYFASYYSGLTSLASRSQPLWIFSLNHDLCVELVADEAKMPWTCGFGSDVVQYRIRNDVTTSDLASVRVIRAKDLAESKLDYLAVAPAINLVKLHGSLDMFVINDEDDLGVLDPTLKGASRLHALGDLYTKSAYFFPGGGEFRALGEIVVSDAKNESQFLRHTMLSGTHKFAQESDQYAPLELLTFFEQKLGDFAVLVAIGYGFGDAHVNERIKAWADAVPSRRIVIVDPYRSSIPPGFETLTARIEIRRQKAIEFLDAEGAVNRSSREQAELRMFRAGRSLTNEERTAVSNELREEDVKAAADKVVDLIKGGLAVARLSKDEAEKLGKSIVGTIEERILREAERLEQRAAQKKATVVSTQH